MQNWAAIAELGRELASHHELATSSRDVIFVGRPDLLYSKAVNFTSMHSLFQAAPTPLVLLTRENERGGKAENTASSFDPMIAAWFASRGALDAMCPTGAHCGGIASGSIQELTEISCGYPYSKLLLLTPGISAFFIPMDWPLCFQRVYTTEPEFVGWSVVYYSNRCSLLLNAFKCIFAHNNAFECIFSAFCVCCILGFVAFSCILDPLCLHSLLLHSSFSRCVHFDAFSDLLHFGYDAF